jgi:hypothetical protein
MPDNTLNRAILQNPQMLDQISEEESKVDKSAIR